MGIKNTKYSYGSVTKFLHWLIFLLVLGMVIAGFFMGDISDKGLKSQVFTIHKLTGLTILGLMFIRLIWALMNPKPMLPDGTKRWERLAEHLGHGLLYLLLIAMPLSGWLMSTAAGYSPSFFGLFSIPMPFVAKSDMLKHLGGDMHEIIAWVIVAVVSIHIIAALRHHFVNKDDVLLRMMPEKKREL